MNEQTYLKTAYNTPFIQRRADPYICRDHEGIYYFTASVPEYDRIVLKKSSSLKGLRGTAEKTIWTRHEKGFMSGYIWAPELHFIENKWYIYFASGEKEDVWKIRPYVLACTGRDPIEDEWLELGQMKAADPFTFRDFSLDMTVFSVKNVWYAVWAEKVSVGKKISNLYIAALKSPSELGSEQSLLSYPSYPWERRGFWVNEGPSILRHGKKIYLTYSASATGADYCMGLLSTDEDADLLDPGQWKKEPLPIMTSDAKKGLYGPGHNSFFKDEHGRDMMAFHARQYDEIVGDPLYDPNRHTYLMEVTWDEEEKPEFTYDHLVLPE
jgi:GH43 family beta-xylosidase